MKLQLFPYNTSIPGSSDPANLLTGSGHIPLPAMAYLPEELRSLSLYGRWQCQSGTEVHFGPVWNNPLCGDSVRMGVDGSAWCHESDGCLILRASASWLSAHLPEIVPDQQRAELIKMRDWLLETRTGTEVLTDVTPEVKSDSNNGNLANRYQTAFAFLAQYPSRRKCALGPVQAALDTLAHTAEVSPDEKPAK